MHWVLKPHIYYPILQRIGNQTVTRVMALSFSSPTAPLSLSKPGSSISQSIGLNGPKRNITMCESKDSASAESSDSRLPAKINTKLEVGSPVIVVEAPKMIKTAASVPCLRLNSGLVNPGDVGRIVSRKPKDVWAVRLRIGTYLIDGKYFKPLDVNE
ncbi:hypothetical protein K2173_020857 [Erythroxylum novogranatense]|uniref:Chlororespiratory reduction 42 n=1 Tax=Erythroxylum novogranatense TaxID=1862640 RepID=A0AAV8TLU5_9ROSI|nr:hypothetical protein K2173_020857 [Erythroxylum novogranatense]